jgi:hypothetical protein
MLRSVVDAERALRNGDLDPVPIDKIRAHITVAPLAQVHVDVPLGQLAECPSMEVVAEAAIVEGLLPSQ